MDIQTASYIITYFHRLLSTHEAAALRNYEASLKLNAAEQKDHATKLGWFKSNNRISEDPEVIHFLDSGIEQFYIRTATRILSHEPGKVYFNNCPNCNKLARTPYARQCRYCTYSWHHTIAANFELKKVFEINLNKEPLVFFAGNLTSGSIQQGMKIDLSFFGLAIKPIIKTIEFLYHGTGRPEEIALRTTITSAEDKAYLLEKNFSRTIIIEK